VDLGLSEEQAWASRSQKCETGSVSTGLYLQVSDLNKIGHREH
jgi:hypothetical protein